MSKCSRIGFNFTFSQFKITHTLCCLLLAEEGDRLIHSQQNTSKMLFDSEMYKNASLTKTLYHCVLEILRKQFYTVISTAITCTFVYLSDIEQIYCN